jgi:hypothetical protein
MLTHLADIATITTFLAVSAFGLIRIGMRVARFLDSVQRSPSVHGRPAGLLGDAEGGLDRTSDAKEDRGSGCGATTPQRRRAPASTARSRAVSRSLTGSAFESSQWAKLGAFK